MSSTTFYEKIFDQLADTSKELSGIVSRVAKMLGDLHAVGDDGTYIEPLESVRDRLGAMINEISDIGR